MPRYPYEHDHEQYLADLKARQRNIVFPDTVRNGRSVDKILWKGDPDAPLVQRIGTTIFGISYFAMGVGFWLLALQEKDLSGRIVERLIGSAVILLALRMFFNAAKRRKHSGNLK